MSDQDWMPNLPGVSAYNWHDTGSPSVRMRYLRAGSGPPLLLIHGFLGYSFSWRFNLVPLSEIATVYAPDLPGTGYSQKDLALDTTLEARADHMLRFADAMKMDRFDLLGTSLGGGLAVVLAARYPARIRRLILVDPINPWSRHGKDITRFGSTVAGSLVLRSAFPLIKWQQRYFVRRMYGDTARITPGTYKGYTAPLRDPYTFDYILNVMRSWQANLKTLQCAYDQLVAKRMLLIWGDRDRAVFPSSAYEVHRRLPNSELIMLKGVGHLAYEEVPDEFNRIVIRFLQDETTGAN